MELIPSLQPGAGDVCKQSAGVSPYSRLSSAPWGSAQSLGLRWSPMGCLKPALADAKPEGFGVFRSLDSLISFISHLLAITSACLYFWRSVLCFSSLFPLLHGSSVSSQGLVPSEPFCRVGDRGMSVLLVPMVEINEIQFQEHSAVYQPILGSSLEDKLSLSSAKLRC